eukprot:3388764-Amphidinium_carterae.1
MPLPTKDWKDETPQLFGTENNPSKDGELEEQLHCGPRLDKGLTFIDNYLKTHACRNGYEPDEPSADLATGRPTYAGVDETPIRRDTHIDPSSAAATKAYWQDVATEEEKPKKHETFVPHIMIRLGHPMTWTMTIMMATVWDKHMINEKIQTLNTSIELTPCSLTRHSKSRSKWDSSHVSPNMVEHFNSPMVHDKNRSCDVLMYSSHVEIPLMAQEQMQDILGVKGYFHGCIVQIWDKDVGCVDAVTIVKENNCFVEVQTVAIATRNVAWTLHQKRFWIDLHDQHSPWPRIARSDYTRGCIQELGFSHCIGQLMRNQLAVNGFPVADPQNLPSFIAVTMRCPDVGQTLRA